MRAWGTTVERIARSMAAGSSPSKDIRFESQTRCSSAVRASSVEARHCPRMRSPSWTANTMFELPASIASSMGYVLRTATMKRRGKG